ncbi:hypothetical protein [Methylobacter sp.]|uniref:hypothetical protein n=1 Tax=Methylobacter sp. TaxID=2051955 RepID=UPI002FDDCB7F
MNSLELEKIDGRKLSLYSRRPIDVAIKPSPLEAPKGSHPLRGESVAYVAYRQTRIFHPPPECNPFGPSGNTANPAELPVGDYNIAVFDNRFPTLTGLAHDVPERLVETLLPIKAVSTFDRLKYPAGTELAAGMFANDALTEDKVKALQAVEADL